jgi:hypothetical protein
VTRGHRLGSGRLSRYRVGGRLGVCIVVGDALRSISIDEAPAAVRGLAQV